MRVRKLTVGELKKALERVNDDADVVLGFYCHDEGVHFGYLADIYGSMKFDSVIKNKIDAELVELVCYDHEHCHYVEKKNGE